MAAETLNRNSSSNQDWTGYEGYENDPYLDFQPAFALSLPVQVLMNTITLTLVTVLLIQLVFTAQYHWPLARLNFMLQFSGVLTLLISLIATVTIVLSRVYERSREWPYMISYIAIPIPPNPTTSTTLLQWTWGQHVAWTILEALVAGLVHVANIQYLTLLYPSRLEKWLLNCLLVPFAVVSSAMEIVHLHSDDDVRHTGDMLRNVCNCTLSLMFLVALSAWGLLIHRRQAWRTDGGTAIFGGAAISLAAVSSALNIIIIPAKDKLFWLQPLVWSVVLWQSFLGWWWWVGCAVDANHVEDMIVRNRKRGARRARKKDGEHSTSSLRSGVSRVVGTLRARPRQPKPSSAAGEESSHVESVEMVDLSAGAETATTSAPPRTVPTETQSVTSYASTHQPFWGRLWRGIRRDHETAALEQALALTANGATARGARWGLGNYAIQERDAAATRVRELRDDEDGEARGLVVDGAPLPTTMALPAQPPPSASWWGPLSRWRLRDRTVYS